MGQSYKVRNNRLKKIIFLSAAALIAGIVFFAARGPHISNLLKKLILPELSAATGRQVLAQKIYINIFPLFIEAKDLRVFENGDEIFHAPRVKGYINVSGLLKRELVLRRLVVREPDIRTNALQLEDIIRSVNEYLKIKRKTPINVSFRSIAVTDGKFTFGYRDVSFKGNGFRGDVLFDGLGSKFTARDPLPQLKFVLNDVSAVIKGLPELKTGVRGSVSLRGNAIDINDLDLDFYGSTINARGNYSEGKGSFKAEAGLFVKSFKKVFALKQRGDGGISAEGTINLAGDDALSPFVDLNLKGDFYIQTLMELLKVDEKVEGLVNFTGSLKGPVTNPAGAADAILRNGNLFGVEVDDLKCRVLYGDGVFNFKEGKASLYNGHADADASLRIVGPSRFSLDIKVSDVDSPSVLKLVGWDPGFPFGKVNGELSTSGIRFNPSGWFNYEGRIKGEDALGRVNKAKGFFILKDDVLSFYDSEANTDKTALSFNGDINIASSGLSLRAQLKTADIRDITVPYLYETTGSGDFSGTVTGSFEDPLISGAVRLHSAFFEDYYLGEVSGDIDYKKNILEAKKVSVVDSIMTAYVKGSIKFSDAKGLFDFRSPLYALSVSMKNADLESFVKVVYRKTPGPDLKGGLNADFSITGPGPRPLYQGSAQINDAKADSFELGRISASLSYDYKDLLFRDVVIRGNSSIVTGEGRISHDGQFNFKSIGSNILLSDLTAYEIKRPGPFGDYIRELPVDMKLDLKAEGKGSVDNPRMEIEGRLYGGRFKGVDIGDGVFKVSVKGKTLLFNTALFNDKMTFAGKAHLKDSVPWSARLDVRSGRYDFLIGAFLKNIPHDLLLNMKGHADMSGDRNHFSAAASISQLNITLYGYSFSNASEISFEIKDKTLSLSAFTMRSGDSSFKVRGDMGMAKGYDLTIEGSSALSPLKGFSKRIDEIKGDAVFVFTVSGGWDYPKINGGIEVANGSLGVKGLPSRISSINGYLYIDEDRLTIKRFSGKISGGDVSAGGIAYFQRFKLKRFYVDAVLDNIVANISRDFSASFDGNLLYKGTPDSQTVAGEVRIKRAKYNERIEWKSWLLKAKAKEKPRVDMGGLDNTILNIKVNGEDNIAVDNNIARASLKVDLMLRGTVSYPVIFGHVESKAGTVYFRNNEFRILNASADFSDPRRTNPVMGIVAEASIKGYNIRMNLDGQLDHFNLSLVSDPQLEEVDIFSLLTVGKLGKELKGIESGIGAGEATSFLTGKVQDVLEERLKTLTGLDRLEVDPYVSKTTGTVNPRVTVSKRLLGDKLFVTYSSAVGTAENNVLKLEYLIGKNTSLIGVRDEKGSLGGDIKFRFEFK